MKSAEEGVLEDRISRKGFMRLGAAIGVTVAGASVIAACGGGENGGGGYGAAGSGDGKTAAGGATGEPESGGEAIAQTSEVPQDSAQKFTDEGKPAVLIHLQSGDFVAYSAVCTHQQCTVAYQEGQLACPCHGSVFDPADGGKVVNGPAQKPLPEIPIQVQNGEVTKA